MFAFGSLCLLVSACVTEALVAGFWRSWSDTTSGETQAPSPLLELLCASLGVLARWRLSLLNAAIPSFPVGTFVANISACALNAAFGAALSRPQSAGTVHALR